MRPNLELFIAINTDPEQDPALGPAKKILIRNTAIYRIK
jgi:hypothetical protein